MCILLAYVLALFAYEGSIGCIKDIHLVIIKNVMDQVLNVKWKGHFPHFLVRILFAMWKKDCNCYCNPFFISH